MLCPPPKALEQHLDTSQTDGYCEGDQDSGQVLLRPMSINCLIDIGTHWAWLSQLSLSRGPISYACSMLSEIRPSGVYLALPMWKVWTLNIWLSNWKHCIMLTYCPSRPYEVPLSVSHPPKLGQLSFEPSRGAFVQALTPLVQGFV